MCGRFSLFAVGESLSNWFDVEISENLEPRFNIAPTQDVPIITNDEQNVIQMARWGLIPNWAKDDKFSSINARSESLNEKPMFKKPLAKHRCIIPANGFYEWNKDKTPFYFKLSSNNLFAFAGVFDMWKSPDGIIKSFSIITVPPNDIVNKIHDRMPAILDKENYKNWLSGNKLMELLVPYPSYNMESYEVNRIVNSPKIEGEHLIKPFIKKQSSLMDF